MLQVLLALLTLLQLRFLLLVGAQVLVVLLLELASLQYRFAGETDRNDSGPLPLGHSSRRAPMLPAALCIHTCG